MARRCAVTGKHVMFGNDVSHANNKSRRRFAPNIQSVSLLSDVLKGPIRLRLSTRGLSTVDKHGGIDAYLLGQADAKLPLELRRIKRRIEKVKAAAAG